MYQTRFMRRGFVAAMTGLVTTVILTACNGGGNDASSNSLSDGGGPSVVANDGFISKVATVAANAPDNTDPELTDSVAATSSDTAEPVAVVL